MTTTGACVTKRPELFNLPRDPERPTPAELLQVRRALAVCAPCPIRDACLAHGLAAEVEGVAGGVPLRRGHTVRIRGLNANDEPHRVQMTAEKVPARTKTTWRGREVAPCGTRQAYQRHRRHGEEACVPCLDAQNAWQREHRNQRRELTNARERRYRLARAARNNDREAIPA